MKSIGKAFIGGLMLGLPFITTAQTLQQLEAKKIQLPNEWSLTPAGTNITLGDLPLNLVISNSRKLAAVTNNGQSTQTIDLIDIKSQKRLDSIIIARSWYGLAFSGNDQFIYASGGHNNQVDRYEIKRTGWP